MEQGDIAKLTNIVNFANISDPDNVVILGHLSREEREEFALATKSLVLYFGAEVDNCRQAEETSVLAARPAGIQAEDLNGLNIGCGDRTISPYLLPVDIMRVAPNKIFGGEHHAFTPDALLALPDELPFRTNSVDYIVSLHMLEHVPDPVGVILHWLDILKPGGGIGIVVPDWRYTWDARNDSALYGHKWNPTPELVKKLYDQHWENAAVLEAINTYSFRLSFDFVLRKPGAFVPFSRTRLETGPSGRQSAEKGLSLA